ncbi:flavoprotein-like protein, partial [Entophlyctis helioformis]
LEETGVEAKLWRVPETLPKEVLDKMHAQEFDLPVITAQDLVEADGLFFGLATRYGTASAQIRSFIDSTGQLFGTAALDGKLGAIFTSTSTQHGGHETTALSFISTFVHHGIIYVPFGYKSGLLFDTKEVNGGSPWGAGVISPSDGSRSVSDKEKEIARAHGKQFGGVVKRFN